MSKRRRNKALEKKMARRHIARLFELAEKEALNSRQDRADRYVYLARKMAMRYNLSLGSYRRHFCRECGAFLVPGRNSTYRLNQGKVTITCGNCGHIYRFPYRQRTGGTVEKGREGKNGRNIKRGEKEVKV